MSERDTLKDICWALDSIEYTQGAGANMSVKVADIMWIKASGYTLQEAAESDGFVALNHKQIAKVYAEQTATEDAARARIDEAIVTPKGKKPSMESGFHAYLPTFVVHTHPLYVNAILCSTQCDEYLEALYGGRGDTATIAYHRPGDELAKAVFAAYNKISRHPKVFFLKNHGLIVTGEDPAWCVDTTKNIAEIAKRAIAEKTALAPAYQPPTKQGAAWLGTMAPSSFEYAFPDAVVFLETLRNAPTQEGRVLYQGEGMSARHAQNSDAILFAHNEIHRMALSCGGVQPLAREDVQALLGMQEEKYRQQVGR